MSFTTFSPLRESSSSSKFVLALQSMIADASESGDMVSRTSVVHRSILQGGFAMLKENISWHTPKWKLNVYLSSMSHYRGAEFDSLVKDLRLLGQQAGTEIRLLDLEGKSADCAILWDDHERELERCRRHSTGLFFITYFAEEGLAPFMIPVRLQPYESDEFSWKDSHRETIQEWYSKDENNLTELYVLRVEKAKAAIKEGPESPQFQSLLACIRGLEGFKLSATSDIYLNRNVDECAAREAFSSDYAIQRSFWVSNAQINKSKSPLREWISSTLPAQQRRNCDNNSANANWRAKTTELVLTSLSTLLNIRGNWELNGCGVGLPGPLLAEMLYHSQLAQSYCERFVGRTGLIQACLDRILGDSFADTSSVPKKSKVHRYQSICCALVGEAGTGKSATAAKLADCIFRTQSQIHRPVIIRFCNATKASSTGWELLHSLVHQIHYVTGQPFDPTVSHFSYSKLARRFQALVAEHSVVVIIDGIDQLLNYDLARTDISFLKGFKDLHKDSRIVITTKPDGMTFQSVSLSGDASSTGGGYYGCDTCLRQSQVNRIQLGQLFVAEPNASGRVEEDDEDAGSEAGQILKLMLDKRNRKLTDFQFASAVQNMKAEPTILYVSLVAKIAQRWHSGSDAAPLAPTVEGLVNTFLDSIEGNYSPKFVHHAVGYLVFSIDGVADEEMIDLLTISMENLINCADWLSLRSLLVSTGIVTEFSPSGTLTIPPAIKSVLLGSRYANETDRRYLKTQLGYYFSDLVPKSASYYSAVLRQPLFLNTADNNTSVWLNSSLINMRRCREASAHLIAAGLLVEAEAELCNIETVCTHFRAGNEFQLLNNLAELSHHFAKTGEASIKKNRRCDYYLRWVRRCYAEIKVQPATNIPLTAFGEPIMSIVRKDIHDLYRSYKDSLSFDVSTWIRCKELGGVHNFDDIISSMGGHEGNVTAVSFSSCGRFVASGSDDNFIRIFDANSGLLLHLLEGHADSITSVAYSPSNRHIIASASRDQTVRIWDSNTGSVLNLIEPQAGPIQSLAFAKDGKTIAAACFDKTIRIFAVSTGESVNVLRGHEGAVTCVCFLTENGDRIASGSFDDTVRTWSVTSGEQIHCLSGHTNAITALANCDDASLIVSASRDKRVIIWDAVTGTEAHVLNGYTNKISAVDICLASPTNASVVNIATSSDDGFIRIWSFKANERESSLMREYTHPVTTLQFDTTGKRLLTGSFSKLLTLWDVSSDSFDRNELKHYGVPHSVLAICVDKSGRHIITGTAEHSVCVWDIATGFIAQNLDAQHVGPVTAVSYLNKSKRIVSGSRDSTICLWVGAVSEDDDIVYSLEKVLEGHTGGIVSLAVDAGTETVLASSCEDGQLYVWNIESSTIIAKVTNFPGHIFCCNFSHHTIINLAEGALGGLLLAGTGSDDIIRVWRVVDLIASDTNSSSATPQVAVWELKGHTSRVSAVCFSKDDRHVVTGSSDKSVRKWTIGTAPNTVAAAAEVITDSKVMQGHSLAVTSIDIHPNNTQLISGSLDKTVRVWDMETGMLLNSLTGHTNKVTCVAFSADGLEIATASSDRTVRVWDSSSGLRRTV